MPAQIDLEHHDLQLRVSDPYLQIKRCVFAHCSLPCYLHHIPPVRLTGEYMPVHDSVADGSPMQDVGIRPGDAILTVNGRDFDTVGEFVALTKMQKDMTWEIVHMPDVPQDEMCVSAAVHCV